MKKCPIKPKTSGLAAGKGEQSLSKQPTWGSLAGLAKLQGCSQRTMRKWCKKGFIPEAYQTKGRHWRIQKPLSIKTRDELEKRRADWPFKGKVGKVTDLFADELAEWLVLAELYQKDVRKRAPVPYTWEPDDDFLQFSQQRFGKKEKAARRIQELIIERLHARKPLHDLLLKGWVYQFWRKNKRCPTVAEITQLMGISRDTFYRRHSRRELNQAYFAASGESKRELPDPDGLDSVQRANRNAKKKTSGSLQRDLYSDD